MLLVSFAGWDSSVHAKTVELAVQEADALRLCKGSIDITI
jgi:hypothetical protein